MNRFVACFGAAVGLLIAACGSGSADAGFSKDSNDSADGGNARSAADAGGGRADGGEGLLDGATLPPAKTDGGSLDAGTTPVSRVVCGSTFCRADQTCKAGNCEFACVGQNVPGDYLTIQDAIDANVGVKDLTVCLGAQSYPEAISVLTSAATPPKSLSITGVSSNVTTITSLLISGTRFSNVVIRGVSITGGVSLQTIGTPVKFIASKILNSNVVGAALEETACADVFLDGCEIASNLNNEGVLFIAEAEATSGSATQSLTIQNSYIHDSYYGISANVGNVGPGTPPTVPVRLINNTFAYNWIGISTTGASFLLDLTYANCLLVDSHHIAVDEEATHESLSTSSNAFFGNLANYGGSAVVGTGYVLSDVKLDTTQDPPALGAGSPARGAADPALAPTTDFWGVARPSSPDIGAVQN